VSEAQRSRAPIQRLRTKSLPVCPRSPGVSVITFAVWPSRSTTCLRACSDQPAVAVLIIACPCASGWQLRWRSWWVRPWCRMGSSSETPRPGDVREGEHLIVDKTGRSPKASRVSRRDPCRGFQTSHNSADGRQFSKTQRTSALRSDLGRCRRRRDRVAGGDKISSPLPENVTGQLQSKRGQHR